VKRVARVVLAGSVATVVSGLPSTVHAILTSGDVLAAARAAGTLLPGRRNKPDALMGALAHVVVSAGWVAVLTAVDHRRKLGVTGGAAAGLLIAALDLAVIGRSYPAIRALPQGPQWLDHVAFGAIVGGLL
jgi:hypothetical protein